MMSHMFTFTGVSHMYKLHYELVDAIRVHCSIYIQ